MAHSWRWCPSAPARRSAPPALRSRPIPMNRHRWRTRQSPRRQANYRIQQGGAPPLLPMSLEHSHALLHRRPEFCRTPVFRDSDSASGSGHGQDAFVSCVVVAHVRSVDESKPACLGMWRLVHHRPLTAVAWPLRVYRVSGYPPLRQGLEWSHRWHADCFWCCPRGSARRLSWPGLEQLLSSPTRTLPSPTRSRDSHRKCRLA